jgi:hypothetical protein
VPFRYEIRIEFTDGEPHAHVTVITPLGWLKRRVEKLVKA